MLQASTRPCILKPGLLNIRLHSKKSKQLQYPEPPTKEHHDRPSYLHYATRTGLDLATTTYNGTLYEYTVRESLLRLGISVQRVGGAFDNGIDLVGTWSLPQIRDVLKVIISCKLQNGTTQTGPRLIRELEGAFVGAPLGWREAGVLGMLVAPKKATKGIREALGRSRWPMGCAMCSTEGVITQLLWNKRAADVGLGHFGVGLRHAGNDPTGKEVVMLWKGEAVNLGLDKSALIVPHKASKEKPEATKAE